MNRKSRISIFIPNLVIHQKIRRNNSIGTIVKAVRTTEIFVTKNISNNNETPDSDDTIFQVYILCKINNFILNGFPTKNMIAQEKHYTHLPDAE